MARLILLLMLFAALALAFAAGVAAWRALTAPAPVPALREDRMPPAIQTTAYVLLFLLLAGLTSGWMGPA